MLDDINGIAAWLLWGRPESGRLSVRLFADGFGYLCCALANVQQKEELRKDTKRKCQLRGARPLVLCA